MSRPLVDIIHLDIRTINAAASTNNAFDIQLSIKRRTQDLIALNCRFVGVTCIGRRPTHFLITFNPLTSSSNATIDNLPTPEPVTNIQFHQMSTSTAQQSQQSTSKMTHCHSEPRGSLHGSIRRGSFDVRSIASENIRRTSLAKLSALPLEAPITKVFLIYFMRFDNRESKHLSNHFDRW